MSDLEKQKALMRAELVGSECGRRGVGSHIYGLGHQPADIEEAFNRGYKAGLAYVRAESGEFGDGIGLNIQDD